MLRPTAYAPPLFVFLQLADFITTIVAIKMGGFEQNLFVSRLMLLDPLLGLLFAKLLVMAIAVAAVMAKKTRALVLANVFYTAVVLWNTSIIARLVLR